MVYRSALIAVGVALAMASTSQAQITARPDVLSGAFEGGFVGEAADRRYPIRVIRIGELDITSGRVLVVDPFWMSTRDKPLSVRIPPGRYPVDLAVADAGESGHRVALARLLFSSAPAIRWELAVTDEQDVATLSGDQIFGYGVEAGAGAFVDANLPARLGMEYPPIAQHDEMRDGWIERARAGAERFGIPYGLALVEREGQEGVAIFSSGWGDGYYASWVGYGADDLPVAIVTDFAVITAVNFSPSSDSN